MFDPTTLRLFPQKSGVYLMLNKNKEVLYVGKAKNLQSRLRQYFSKNADTRLTVGVLLPQVESIDTIVVNSEKEALILENTLIKKHHPKYNILLKDDKNFLCIALSLGKWPKLDMMRAKKIKEPYFGPYTNALAAKQTLELILRLFPLRQCSDREFENRSRPCILYEMGRCIAPCVGKCSHEEYMRHVKAAEELLLGKDKSVIKMLKGEMAAASKKLEFEKAASLLKQIRQIKHVTQVQHVDNLSAKNCDALGIYIEKSLAVLVKLHFENGKLVGSNRYSFTDCLQDKTAIFESFILQHYTDLNPAPKTILSPCKLSPSLFELVPNSPQIITPQKGEKLKLVEMAKQNALALYKKEKDYLLYNEQLLLDLQEKLHLSRFPKRIECLDISHIGGSEIVGAVVCFTNGRKDKSRTKLYKIPAEIRGDSPAMEYALAKHFGKKEARMCDLLLVDGGIAQIRAAEKVFRKLGIALVDLAAITKEQARHDKGLTKEKILLQGEKPSLLLDPKDPLLFLLQKIRDAAHHTAISFQRKRRGKASMATALDDIAGLGPVKKKLLLQTFGSVERILKATKEELLQVPKITKKDTNNILSSRNERDQK